MREEVKWWLQAGNRDKEMTKKLLEQELFEGCAFHAQQSAEKVLKALLVNYGREARTHSCVHILKMLKMERLTITKEVELAAKKLDSHYTQSRYPNGAGGPPEDLYSEEIAKEATECMKKVHDFTNTNL